MVNTTVVMIGLGQLGRIFAGGFLRIGCKLVPVNRGDDMAQIALLNPAPALVMISVGENDLHPVLAALPQQWKDKICLIQNELLPRDWQQHQLDNSTVISVWFEKKKGIDARPLLPSPVFGPVADRVVAALQAIDLPACVLPDEQTLCYELVRKNVYILTTNIAGMKTGGNVSQLWKNHRSIATAVAQDVMDVQDWLTGQVHDREHLMRGMLEAFEVDPEHMCMGRSAPARLTRALEYADEAGLKVATLRSML